MLLIRTLLQMQVSSHLPSCDCCLSSQLLLWEFKASVQRKNNFVPVLQESGEWNFWLTITTTFLCSRSSCAKESSTNMKPAFWWSTEQVVMTWPPMEGRLYHEEDDNGRCQYPSCTDVVVERIWMQIITDTLFAHKLTVTIASSGH